MCEKKKFRIQNARDRIGETAVCGCALYRELEDVEYFILDMKIFEKGKGKFVVVRIFLSYSSSNLVKIPRTCLPFPR